MGIKKHLDVRAIRARSRSEAAYPNLWPSAGAWSPCLNPPGGSTLFDLSGRGNHGTLTNGPTWETSLGFSSIHTDNISSYVSFPLPSSMFNGEATAIMWLKASPTDQGNGAWYLGTSTLNTTYTWDNVIYDGAFTSSRYVVGSTAVNLNTLHRVAITFSKSGVWTFRQNNITVYSTSGANFSVPSVCNFGRAIPTENYYINAHWFDIRIYTKCLTESELYHDYSLGPGGWIAKKSKVFLSPGVTVSDSTGSSSFSVAVSGSGASNNTGTGSSSFSVSVNGSGSSTNSGTGSSSFSVAVSGIGTSTNSGIVGTSEFIVSVAGVGATNSQASGSCSFSIAVAGASPVLSTGGSQSFSTTIRQQVRQLVARSKSEAAYPNLWPDQGAWSPCLNPQGGLTLFDKSGMGLDGTLVSTESEDWTTLLGYPALLLDGVNEHITLPNITEKEAGSLVFWVSPSTTITTSQAFGIYVNAPLGESTSMICRWNDALGAMDFYLLGSGYLNVRTTTTTWTAGQLYQIVCRWDGTYQSVAVNGHIEATIENISPISLSNGGMILGASFDGAALGYWPGCILDFRIYNCYQLSAADIALDFKLGPGGWSALRRHRPYSVLGPSSSIGSGTASFSVTALGTGSSTAIGTGSSSFTINTSGIGSSQAIGTGSSSFTVNTSGIGVSQVIGTGSSSFAVNVSGIGSSTVTGAGTGSSSFTITTSGVGFSQAVSTGASSFSVATSGIGSTTITGSGVSSFSVVISGIGSSKATGNASAVVNFTVNGVGSTTVTGTGSSSFSIIVNGIGSAIGGSTGIGTITITMIVASIGASLFRGSGSSVMSVICNGISPTSSTGVGLPVIGLVSGVMR